MVPSGSLLAVLYHNLLILGDSPEHPRMSTAANHEIKSKVHILACYYIFEANEYDGKMIGHAFTQTRKLHTQPLAPTLRADVSYSYSKKC